MNVGQKLELREISLLLDEALDQQAQLRVRIVERRVRVRVTPPELKAQLDRQRRLLQIILPTKFKDVEPRRHEL